MAVKARDDVTLANITDVANVRRYYLLQASTLAAPAAPTANPAPSPWVTTEPTYTEGSTNSLYTVDLTVFSDGTFDYSTVSKSSSYEAAKVAYNKATAATTAAAAAQAKADQAMANAAELVMNGKFTSGTNGWIVGENNGTVTIVSDSSVGYCAKMTRGSSTSLNLQFWVSDGNKFPVTQGRTLSLTASMKGTTTKAFLRIWFLDTAGAMVSYADAVGTKQVTGNWVTYGGNINVPANAVTARVGMYNTDAGTDLYVTNVSCRDVTEALAAQATADAAKAAAATADGKANAAANAAAAATNTANSANQMATEGTIIVRRNLHKSPLGPGATSIPIDFTKVNNATISWSAGLRVVCTAGATDSGVRFGSAATIDYTVPANRTLTVGLDVTGITAGSWRISVQGGWVGAVQNGGYTAVAVGETKRLSFTFYTTSAGTADPILYLLRSTSTGTESARISNIVLAEGSVDFFDGDTTPDSSLTPDWEGEEQKSVSTLSRVSTAIKKSNLNSIDVSKLTAAMAGLISMSVSQPVSSVAGSMWFELDDDENLIGVYYFDGDNWQRYAFIADSVMVPSSIGPTLIQDGAIQTPHLSANSVTSEALASGSVSTENLTIGAITKAVLDDTLAGTISDAQEWADKVVLTNESITITNGLISPTSLVLRNNRLTFYVNGIAVAYIDSSAQQMSIKSAIIENTLKVGKHAIEAYTSEITIMRWVG